MGLRAKLAAIFLLLLVLPIVAVSALEIDRTLAVMVNDLADSGTLLINQTFEQIRMVLRRASHDPATALRKDRGLLALLNSSQAFSKGVVYVGVESRDGSIIVGSRAGLRSAAAQAPAPFEVLERQASAWWPPSRIRAVWNERTYEISRRVDIGNRPFAVIKVGVSTSLISAEARHSVEGVLGIGAIAIGLSLFAALFFGRLLLRPVEAILSGVEQITAGRDEVWLTVAGGDELGTLAEKFNELSRRIKFNRTQWETERGQFFNIFRSITDAMLLLDAKGAVLFANAEAQGRLGLPAGGLADGKPLNLLLGKDNPLVKMIEATYTAGTEVHNVALEVGDGANPARLLVSVFSLGQGPEPPGLLVIVRDLEPVKELENVVDYSGRLVRLGGLISGVAHQIRNPLNAMSLQLELLAQDAELDRPIETRIQAVRMEISRLDQAVDALMRFMRPEDLRLGNIRLNDLLVEAGKQVARPDIQVQYDLDPNVGAINADRALLSEALKNLAHNGTEAMPDGGTLTFKSRMGPDGVIELVVTDEGQGIPDENLNQIFQLYFTTKEGGSGLGLPLALRAIDLHQGTIDVQSRVGLGTSIRIRLPADRSAKPFGLLEA